jgi:hypothetical protein
MLTDDPRCFGTEGDREVLLALAASPFEGLVAELGPSRVRVHGPREVALTKLDGNGLVIGRCRELREEGRVRR